LKTENSHVVIQVIYKKQITQLRENPEPHSKCQIPAEWSEWDWLQWASTSISHKNVHFLWFILWGGKWLNFSVL
jgi:hypothetical protein